jgi:hypothetical protein
MVEHCDLFLSYNSLDGQDAVTLAAMLKAEDINAYTMHNNLLPGDEWIPEIKTNIARATLWVPLISKNLPESKWVFVEAGAAWALGKEIVPAILDAPPTELFDLFRYRQALPVKEGPEKQAFVKKVREKLIAMTNRGLTPRSGCGVHEMFNEANHWPSLLRVGSWVRDARSGVISGQRMHSYLLSRDPFVPPYNISAVVKFTDLKPKNKLDAVNAGVVFGWTTPNGVRRYYNLRINTDVIALELIGDRGGDAYADFTHIDPAGKPFKLQPDTPYTIDIAISSDAIEADISDGASLIHYAHALPENAEGLVGLRPWRSTMHIERFEIFCRR